MNDEQIIIKFLYEISRWAMMKNLFDKYLESKYDKPAVKVDAEIQAKEIQAVIHKVKNTMHNMDKISEVMPFVMLVAENADKN